MTRDVVDAWDDVWASRSWTDTRFQRIRRPEPSTRVVLEDRVWSQCHFTGCVWGLVEFRGCVFEDCTWEGCDLSGARFEDTSLRDVTFRGCKLMGVWGSGLRFSFGVVFRDCVVRSASFQGANLERSVWEACAAHEVNFEDANLRGAVFNETVLSGAVFHRADLTRADLRAARGVELDPRSVRLSETRLSLDAWLQCAPYMGVQVDL